MNYYGAGPGGFGEFERAGQLPCLVPSAPSPGPAAGRPSWAGDGPGRLDVPLATPSSSAAPTAPKPQEGSPRLGPAQSAAGGTGGGLKDPALDGATSPASPGGRDGSGSGPGSGERTKVFHGKGSFPLNLANMLESAALLNMTHVVSWLPCGQSFAIYDVEQFLAIMLPKFFKSNKNTKIRSFYRKLNRWGFAIKRSHPNHFTKPTIGPMKGVWHHPNFYRSRAADCLRIALETGDTSPFLSVTHRTTAKGDGKLGMEDGPMPPSGGGGGNEGSSSHGKRKASPAFPEKHFHTGVQKLDADMFSAQAVLQAMGSLTNHDQAAVAAAYGGLSNSLAAGFAAGPAAVGPAGAVAGLDRFGQAAGFAYQPLAAAAGRRSDPFAAAGTQDGAGAGLTSKRGRRNTEFCNDILSSSFQGPPQPAAPTSAAAGGNRGRLAASWTAGAFSQ